MTFIFKSCCPSQTLKKCTEIHIFFNISGTNTWRVVIFGDSVVYSSLVINTLLIPYNAN